MGQKRRGFNQGSDLTNVYLETSQRQILHKRMESDWVWTDINKMKSFLLLILSLNTGCVGLIKVQGCTGGWVDLTCRYPNPVTNYKNIEVETPRRDFKQLEQNKWEEGITGLYLYHNTTGRHLRMIVNPIGNKDFGNYKCYFIRERVKFDLEDESVCLEDLVQTTHRTTQTSIDCDHQGFNFICKENGFTCDTILHQTSALSLVKTISSVSLQDAGVYWCGSESQTQGYRVSRRKIRLDVKDTEVTQKQVTSGQTFTHECKYTALPVSKFFCKGEDPLRCQKLVGSNKISNRTRSNERFLFKDDRVNTVVIITVLNVTTEDTGSYWCGYKSPKGNEDLFFHKLELTVAGHWKTYNIVKAVCVAVLLLLLLPAAVFFIYKRINRFNNMRNEEHCYENITGRPHEPNSGTALRTI